MTTTATMQATRPLTRKQYAAREAERIRAEYPELGRDDAGAIRDAAEMHTDSGWWPGVEEYAKSGGVFRALWLHALSAERFILLSKYHPESIPIGYVRPA